MIKYIFKALLSRISIIRKIIKIKILNRKKDLTIINFLWMLYTEFSKTTFYKILFLSHKVIFILLAIFSFITAYVHDLSWFNLALLGTVILSKLYSIYNIITNKDDSINTEEFDPFIYASMAIKSLSDSNIEEESKINDDNNKNIGLILIFLLLFGGITFYQWDNDLITTLKNISHSTFVVIKTIFNKTKEFIIARFSVTRDDDNNDRTTSIRDWERQNRNNQPYPRFNNDNNSNISRRSRYNNDSDSDSDSEQSDTKDFRKKVINIEDNRSNLPKNNNLLNSTNTTTSNSELAKTVNSTDSTDVLNLSNKDFINKVNNENKLDSLIPTPSDIIMNLKLDDFNPLLLKSKETYNVIRSILNNNNFNKDLPDFNSVEYNNLINEKYYFDKASIKYIVNGDEFKAIINNLVNKSENSSIHSKILNDAMYLDTKSTPEIKIDVSTPSTSLDSSNDTISDSKSKFGSKIRGMFNKKSDDTPSLDSPITISEIDSKTKSNLFDGIANFSKNKLKKVEENEISDKSDALDSLNRLNKGENYKENNPMLAQLKNLKSIKDQKPIFKEVEIEENSNIQDPDIKKQMNKIRKANDSSNDNNNNEWIDSESPTKVKFNPKVEIKKEITSLDDIPIKNEEYELSYENINFNNKNKPELIRNKLNYKKDIDDFNNNNNNNNNNNLILNTNNETSIEDLIKLNKDLPIPKNNRIIDTKNISTIEISKSEDEEMLDKIVKIANNLTKKYHNNKSKFIEETHKKHFPANLEKPIELDEGARFYNDTYKCYYKFDGDKFILDQYDNNFSTEKVKTINNTIKNIDIKTLLKSSSDDNKLVRPSKIREKTKTIEDDSSLFDY